MGISFLPGKANSERLDTNHTKSRRENEFSKLSDLGTLGIYVHILYISNVIHRPNTTNPPYTPPHPPTNPTCPNPLSRPPPPTHVELGWVGYWESGGTRILYDIYIHRPVRRGCVPQGAFFVSARMTSLDIFEHGFGSK